MSNDRQIVQGVRLSPSGQATIDPGLAEVLFDLALRLEESTGLAVDVQHVAAAVVLAGTQGQLPVETELSANDPAQVQLLTDYVKMVFRQTGGRVGEDD